MRLLVADDDPSARAIVCRVARKTLNCLTDEASDGLECLEYLERRRYSLIVLDLQMPILDGIETLEVIRQAPALRDMPVVMFTGGGSEAQVRQAAGLGVSAYLVKPVDPVQLAARLALVASSHMPELHGPERPGANVVVVCDADPSFRRRIAQMLAAEFLVHEADSGTAVLRMLVDEADASPVHAVLCGTDTGLLTSQMLARQVRMLPAGPDIPMCVALPREEVGAALQTGLWDGVLSASLPAQMFVSGFSRALTRSRGQAVKIPAPPLQVVEPPSADAGSRPEHDGETEANA